MADSERDDIIGSWSVEKLGLPRKYLAAYVTILKSQSWCRGYEYIDAFAGTGKPKSREEQRYVDGSPSLRPGSGRGTTTSSTGWDVDAENQEHSLPD